MNVGIRCQNMPTDGSFAFSVPVPDPQDTIIMGKTQITEPDQAYAFPVTYPANFQTSFTLSFWQGATLPPEGSSITLLAQTVRSPRMTRIEPEPVVVIGAVPIVFRGNQ